MTEPGLSRTSPLPPGSVIGIIGGGQLGRMTALAAARLGYRTHVLCPEPDSPCAQVTDRHSWTSYDDHAALAHFAKSVDVVTLEFENVPCETIRVLQQWVPARPSADVLAICQDRLLEKRFIAAAGIAVPPFAEIADRDAIEPGLAQVGRPAVLKSRRLGYDGKSQVRIDGDTDLTQAWQRIGAGPAIVESFVPFAAELSVIVARTALGDMRCYPAVENRHRNHVLSETIVPARVSEAVAAEAERIARVLAAALKVEGLLAVEMFLTQDDQILVNELAPRPHNSGHWSLDAAATSQFEQLVRAVCGLPLGDTAPTADAVMTNLLGDDIDDWPSILQDPGARLHIYGKGESRPGRKMGHVTRLEPTLRPSVAQRLTSQDRAKEPSKAKGG